MRFTVKKNPLLVIIVLSLFPIGIIGLFTEDGYQGWIGLVVLLIIEIPIIWALMNSYHEITDDKFIMVFGPIKKEIPLYDIKAVQYSYNPLSSPAWTFKRVELVYSHYKSMLMSAPQNEKEFKEFLQNKCPQAKIKL